MLILQICLLGVIVASFIFWWSRKSLRYYADKIPGPTGWPLLGMVHVFLRIKASDIYPLWSKLIEPFKMEKIVKMWMGPKLWIYCFNPEDTKIVLNSNACLDKPRAIYDNVFDFGLISINGEVYKAHRKAIMPLFTPKSLKSYLTTINAVTNEFLINFDKNLRKEDIDISQNIMKFSLASSLKTFLNIDSISEEIMEEFLYHVESFSELVLELCHKPWMKLDRYFKLFKTTRELESHHFHVYRLVETFLSEHEYEFQSTIKNENKKPNPFLDLFYPLRPTMTYEQTLEAFFFFLSASFETNGKAISSVLLLLAMNPAEQEKVFDEISSILTSEFEEIDEEKLSKMVYLDLIIKESLRLLPVGFFFGREALEDLNFSTCVVPKGSQILIVAIKLHTNKSLWGSDAMEFKPDRFIEENIRKVHPYAYVPFSGGARVCPGAKYANLTMKIFLCKFLMKYRVTTQLKYEELDFELQVTLKLKQGFMVKVEKR